MVAKHPDFTEDGKRICPICKVGIARNAETTREHLVMAHDSSKTIQKHKCPHCPKKFTKPSNLQFHIQNVHVTEKKYECSKCDLKFKTSNSLSSHMRQKHHNLPNVLCPHCPKLVNPRFLKQHIKRCHETNPLVCDECGKTFQNEEKLKTHRKTHTKQEPLLCPYFACQKVCNGRLAQRNHLKSVHGPKERNHQCSYCSKMFATPGDVTRHENSIHLGVKTLKCDQCDYASNFSSAITEHIKAKHLGILFDCDYPGCDKSYDKKGNLDAHRWRVHKIPRPTYKLILQN